MMRSFSSLSLWDLDSWEEVWTSLRRNRLRTFLTAFGVFWGMLMLTLLLGFGAGLEHGVTRDFLGFAKNSLFIHAERTLFANQGLGPGRWVQLTNDDMEAVRSLPGVMLVAPRLNFGNWGEGQNVEAGTKTGNFPITATSSEYASVEPLELVAGRHFNPRDLAEERKVAVIGPNVARVLFGDEPPVGRYFRYKGVFFQVVGQFRSTRSGQQADRTDNSIYLPLTTAQRAFNRRGIVGWVSVALDPAVSSQWMEREIVARLKKRHRVHPDDPQGIRSYNLSEEYQRITDLFMGVRVFVWIVGVATLLAGVLGVSNILLITVKERTKEIGIRKALGATPVSIMRMVLVEALVLTASAGYVGIVSAVTLLELAGRITASMPQAPISEPEVKLEVALIAGALLLAAGLLATIIPARHAVRIHPVEALRAA